MAKQDEAMSLFPEIFSATKKLTDAQFGALIRAGREYQTDGTIYSGDDIAVDIAFQFLSSQIDRRTEASTKKTAAANKRWKKDAQCTPMQSDAQACTAMQDPCTPMQSDAPIHSIPIHSIPVHKESKADEPPAPTKQAKKSYGEFGWVKLTDDEFNRLLNDLGEAEVNRCIAYVDESAKMTNNKNKWRDWNLVIRKCHREGWGKANWQKPRKASVCTGPRQLDDDEKAAVAALMEG